MDMVTSLLKWVSDWVGRAFPSEEEERASVRLALKEEQAKPARQRNEKRLLALLEEDKRLTYDYCTVCYSPFVVRVTHVAAARARRRGHRRRPAPRPFLKTPTLPCLQARYVYWADAA